VAQAVSPALADSCSDLSVPEIWHDLHGWLPTEIGDDLAAQARARGLDVSEFISQLLRERASAVAGTNTAVADRPAACREAHLDLPHTAPLSDFAVSRERLYGSGDE
jgi:hypothetical protein